MRRTRVEFRLSMPNRASWDGRWSGADANYILIRTVDAEALLGDEPERTWHHRWADGWTAAVTARRMEPRERRPKSDGFCGYDWMVENILRHGSTANREKVSP